MWVKHRLTTHSARAIRDYKTNTNLSLSQLAQAADGGANRNGGSGGWDISATGDGLAAATAVPDANSLALNSVLACFDYMKSLKHDERQQPVELSG